MKEKIIGAAGRKAQDGQVDIIEKELRELNHGEALIDVEYCGVCHSDLHIVDGTFPYIPNRFIGHEGIGVVSKIHPSVKSLKVGDRVSVAWFYSGCGNCEYCNTGRETFCHDAVNAGFSADGALASKCIVIADYAVKVPEGLDPKLAAPITCAGVTTYKAVKVSDIKPGEWLVVYGIGGLGHLAVEYAKKVFNAKVIAVDIDDEKLELAKKVGADLVCNSVKEDPIEFINKNTNGGAQAAIVSAVAKKAFDQAIFSVKRCGTVVAVAIPPVSMDLPVLKTVLDGIKVVGSLVGTRTDLKEAYQFAKEGIAVPVVTVKPFKEINNVLKDLKENKITGRVVIDMKQVD